MTSMNDRERGFEAKFAHDEDARFRVTARRNRLFGVWAAERMGLTAAESDAYAVSVVQADFEEAGDDDVLRKVAADLTAAGKGLPADELRARLEATMAEARRQFTEQPASGEG